MTGSLKIELLSWHIDGIEKATIFLLIETLLKIIETCLIRKVNAALKFKINFFFQRTAGNSKAVRFSERAVVPV